VRQNALVLKNFVHGLQALLKKTKAKLKKVLTLELEDHRIRKSLIPEFEAMAQKSLCEFSAPTTVNIHTRPEVNVGDNGFEIKLALWCKLISFVKRFMKMQVHIYNTFYRSAAPSLSREYLEMLFYSAFSIFTIGES
jgi:hypothetical protein